MSGDFRVPPNGANVMSGESGGKRKSLAGGGIEGGLQR